MNEALRKTRQSCPRIRDLREQFYATAHFLGAFRVRGGAWYSLRREQARVGMRMMIVSIAEQEQHDQLRDEPDALLAITGLIARHRIAYAHLEEACRVIEDVALGEPMADRLAACESGRPGR